jgi:hypothetical protein
MPGRRRPVHHLGECREVGDNLITVKLENPIRILGGGIECCLALNCLALHGMQQWFGVRPWAVIEFPRAIDNCQVSQAASDG